MALLTLDQVQQVPFVKDQPVEYLNMLVGMAEEIIRDYLKINVDETTYTEFYSGTNQPRIILKQRPVSSITDLWFDPGGFYGKPSGSFASNMKLTQGTQYVLELDSGGTLSHRGTVLRMGGVYQGFIGYFPENFYTDKLGASRLPSWPRGEGNIKVTYTAGYSSANVPKPIQYAAIKLVSIMARTTPIGDGLISENLGGYSYSLSNPGAGGADNATPEIASIARSLSKYREIIF